MRIRVLLAALALASIPAPRAAAQLFDFTRTQLVRETQAGGAELPGDNFGYALATGDYNGDGYDDLIVGAPGADVGNIPGAGAVFLYRGSPSGLVGDGSLFESDAGQTSENGDQFGWSVAMLDFNRDGYSDVVVGIPSKSGNAGAFAFWKGSPTGIDLGYSEFYLQTQVCGASETGDRFGTALAAGFLGGATLFVGVTGEDNGAGIFCRVGAGGHGVGGPIFGAGIPYFQDRIFPDAVEAGDHFGSAIAIGRVNGDGLNDLLVGAVDEAPGANPAGGQVTAFYQNTGEGDLLQNGELFDESLASNDTIETGDHFGAAIAASDTTPSIVAIGAPGEDGDAGAIFVGGFPGAVLRIDESFAGGSVESGNSFGAALAWGDFDRDGSPDLIVGTPGEGAGPHPTTSGVVVAFPGGPGGALSFGSYFEQENLGVGAISQSGDRLGFALAVGDFDGDGRDELAIGAPGDHPNGLTNTGAVYVVPEPEAPWAAAAAAAALAAREFARRRKA